MFTRKENLKFESGTEEILWGKFIAGLLPNNHPLYRETEDYQRNFLRNIYDLADNLILEYRKRKHE